MGRIKINYITNSGENTWIKIEKIMKHVNLNFWQDVFKTLRKIFYTQKNKNPLDMFIMDEKQNAKFSQ
jgi:hypothetical protein